VGTLKDAGIEFEVVWDTAVAGFLAVMDAYFGDTVIGLCLADNPLGEGGTFPAGTQVFRADCAILKFDRNEPLENAVTVSVTAKPTYSANLPVYEVIGGTGLVVLTFSRALVAGAGALDLTAIPSGSGTYDGTGKTVVALAVTNNGANTLTVSPAESNGYDLLGGDSDLVIPAGATARLTLDAAPAIASDAKALDLAGTGVQVSTWTVTLAVAPA
ncbi:MAG: hypothetical protein IMZ66_01365, partial [Planctomycetes bacterium]|nr:hypothetical protein [Planctomycetota bacterium]